MAEKAKFRVGQEVRYTPEPPDEDLIPSAAPVEPAYPYPWCAKVETLKDRRDEDDNDEERTYSLVTTDGKHAFDAKESELKTEKEAREEARALRRQNRTSDTRTPGTDKARDGRPGFRSGVSEEEARSVESRTRNEDQTRPDDQPRDEGQTRDDDRSRVDDKSRSDNQPRVEPTQTPKSTTDQPRKGHK